VADDNPPRQPKTRSERREQTARIAEISHRIADIGNSISNAVRGNSDQIITLTNQIKSDNKTTDIRDKDYQDRSLCWMKKGTIASLALSIFSLFTALGALYVVYLQLSTMRIEQRAWIRIEQGFEQIAENKPLRAIVSIKNTGKTPAKRVDQRFSVQIVKSGDSPNLDPVGGFTSFAGLLPPDVTGEHRVPLFRETFDLLNPPLMTKADVDDIDSGKAYLAIVGRITYIDVYGVSHWINLCHWQTNKRGTYPTRKCVEFNDADDN
jgi:hypothetical protein